MMQLGANLTVAGICFFRVWAPYSKTVEVVVAKSEGERIIKLTPDEFGYFQGKADFVEHEDRYFYILDNKLRRSDPVSRYLPEGVHGASEVIDPNRYKWQDNRWQGIALEDYLIYELHIGTFSKIGTFEGAIEKIPHLKELGVTAVEIMPVSQFSGNRNWGYDGVGLFAVQNSYGGPEGLKKFVESCHLAGIAVILDVVYNHFGPEGNYLHDFGYYFSDKYQTLWGDSVNFDGAYSDPVREFILSNALYWVDEYHIDALRLDAVHGIFDLGANHILKQLKAKISAFGKDTNRYIHLIAESDSNDRQITTSLAEGGYGLDSQWSDDFHHALHSVLTGEVNGYYEDYGGLQKLADAIDRTFVYNGCYSLHRKRKYGNSVLGVAPHKFIIGIQNHDQIGNRAFGDRISSGLLFSAEKLSAFFLLLPYTPFLFMGQEYGEKAPFQFFMDHGDKPLIKAVRKGRKKEFVAFGWNDVPDPKALQTFLDSKLNWNLISEIPHKQILKLYKEVIKLRKYWKISAVKSNEDIAVVCDEKRKCLTVRFPGGNDSELLLVLSFSDKIEQSEKDYFQSLEWDLLLHSEESQFGGSIESLAGVDKSVLYPQSFALYVSKD